MSAVVLLLSAALCFPPPPRDAQPTVTNTEGDSRSLLRDRAVPARRRASDSPQGQHESARLLSERRDQGELSRSYYQTEADHAPIVRPRRPADGHPHRTGSGSALQDTRPRYLYPSRRRSHVRHLKSPTSRSRHPIPGGGRDPRRVRRGRAGLDGR